MTPLIRSQRTKTSNGAMSRQKLDADMAKGLVNVATYLQSTAAIRAKYEEGQGQFKAESR